MFDRAEARDRFAELLSLVRVPDRFRECELRSAGHGRAEFEAADVENVKGDLRAVADVADQIVYRNLCIREDQRSRRRRLDAHLMLLASRAAIFASFDDER